MEKTQATDHYLTDSKEIEHGPYQHHPRPNHRHMWALLPHATDQNQKGSQGVEVRADSGNPGHRFPDQKTISPISAQKKGNAFLGMVDGEKGVTRYYIQKN